MCVRWTSPTPSEAFHAGQRHETSAKSDPSDDRLFPVLAPVRSSSTDAHDVGTRADALAVARDIRHRPRRSAKVVAVPVP